MNLIIETDIGHDPDDFFALCYFVSAGVNIRAVTIAPGDHDQIAIARFLLDELGLKDVPIGVFKLPRNFSPSGVHKKILQKYNKPFQAHYDGYGCDVIKQTVDKYPDCELFMCGPISNVGEYLRSTKTEIKRSTMQGGFVSYSLYRPTVTLDKFEGQNEVSTFNMNGDVKSVFDLLDTKIQRNFVGKNVCHTILYDQDVHKKVMSTKPKNRASELLREGMSMYLAKHNAKKFHDPTAAVCHLHPECGTWIQGSLYRDHGKWGTKLGGSDNFLIDIDRDALWNYISEGI
jgi:pyrimidine-specific ribonucleoside hydrolase